MNGIGGLTLVDTVQDFGAGSVLNGAVEVVTTVIGGALYVFVSGAFDDGLQVMRLDAGQLVPVFSLTDTANTALSAPAMLRVADVGGDKFLIVLNQDERAIGSFRIDQTATATQGHLTHVQTLQDTQSNGTLPFFEFTARMETVVTSGGTFIVSASLNDDAINVLQVGSDGVMTLRDTVRDIDQPDLKLDSAYALDVHQQGGQTYVYAGALSQEQGISVFSMAANGDLTSIQNLVTTDNAGFSVFTVVASGADAHLVALDSYNNEFKVYDIAANGTLTLVSSLDWGTLGGSANFTRADAMIVEGVTFLVATEASYDRVSVFSLNPQTGVLERVEVVTRPDLDGVVGISAFSFGGRQYVVSAAQGGDSVTLLEVGAQDDALTGTATDDQIVGLGGDDDILLLAGNDLAYGGAGDDVISGRGGNDRMFGGTGADVLIGGVGRDVLTGGAGADILVGGAGDDLASYDGSTVAVSVNLTTGAVSGGDATGDVLSAIEDVGGSSRNDTLTGNGGGNLLSGGAGDDRLTGLAGNDSLAGGQGADLLYGGDGIDTLTGDSGQDQLFGGADNDVLRGGQSGDVLTGDAGNDQLFGESEADTLTGGAGDDSMDGGLGADVFRFAPAFGSDQITGFSIAEDRLDFSALPEIGSFAAFQSSAVSFAGNTLVTLSDGSSLVLLGVVEAQFTPSNFLF